MELGDHYVVGRGPTYTYPSWPRSIGRAWSFRRQNMTASLPGDHRHPALLPQAADTRNREGKARLISSQAVSFAFVYIHLCSMFKYLFHTNFGLHWNQLMANAPDAPVSCTSPSSSPFSLISWQASNIVRPALSFTHQYNNHHMPFVESGGLRSAPGLCDCHHHTDCART